MNVVSQLTLDALKEHGNEPLAHYGEFLAGACEEYPPPYGMEWYGEKYREAACDPFWLANSLIANASKEGEGSRKLWVLAGSAADPQVADQVRRHAVDEARHAKLYIKMLTLAFPEAADEALLSELNDLSPGYTSEDQPPAFPFSSAENVLDDLIQMNIGEIRTRIHQLLLRPVITAYCPDEEQEKLTRVLDSLLLDETRHIHYTAKLIEDECARGRDQFVNRVMKKRMDEFNQITLQEVGELTFEGA